MVSEGNRVLNNCIPIMRDRNKASMVTTFETHFRDCRLILRVENIGAAFLSKRVRC